MGKWCKGGDHSWVNAEDTEGGDPWMYVSSEVMPKNIEASGLRCTKCGKFQTVYENTKTGNSVSKPRGFDDSIMRWENA